jgi:hypothetical protein
MTQRFIRKRQLQFIAKFGENAPEQYRAALNDRRDGESWGKLAKRYGLNSTQLDRLGHGHCPYVLEPLIELPPTQQKYADIRGAKRANDAAYKAARGFNIASLALRFDTRKELKDWCSTNDKKSILIHGTRGTGYTVEPLPPVQPKIVKQRSMEALRLENLSEKTKERKHLRLCKLEGDDYVTRYKQALAEYRREEGISVCALVRKYNLDLQRMFRLIKGLGFISLQV